MNDYVRCDSDAVRHMAEQSTIALESALDATSVNAREEWFRVAGVQALQAIALGLAGILVEEEHRNGR